MFRSVAAMECFGDQSVAWGNGDVGLGHMQRFQDVETRTLIILATGLDAPTCRNVVALPNNLPDVLKLPDIFHRGNVNGIIGNAAALTNFEPWPIKRSF